ncbi:MAG TPA: beta-ketoacyl synthase N-terminal-like domain-containing protein, partial [Actinomycetota bacterium]|nr:beta-ketoacyl synthase N-terminal-like domain-containing protein [Actinomycetota bacterium]
MERVFITGIGTVNPLGLDAPSTWEAMLEGRSGIDTIAAFDPSPYPARIAGEVRGF